MERIMKERESIEGVKMEQERERLERENAEKK